MIEHWDGDITSIVHTESGIIGHCVNCQGMMGSGVALALLTKWPIVRSKLLTMPIGKGMLGFCDVFEVENNFEPVYVANIYGQEFCGNNGKRYGDLEAMALGLERLFKEAIKMKVTQLHFPYKMASDRAGLDWEDEVMPLITRLSDSNPSLTVNIWKYNGDI